MIVVIVVKVILVINIKRKHRLIKDKGNTYAHVHIYIEAYIINAQCLW